MQNEFVAAITSAEDLVTLADDNINFNFWKRENSLLLSKLGISTELEKEAKLYSPHMLRIVLKYENKFNKPRREFNLIEDAIVHDEFERMYQDIATGKLDYTSTLLNI